jgi:hypothetical protein
MTGINNLPVEILDQIIKEVGVLSSTPANGASAFKFRVN